MTLITGIMQSKIINALDTYRHVAGTNNMYKVSCDVNEIPPSGVSVVIQQNGSTKFSSAAPAASQQLVSGQIVLNCAANDNIDIIVSSSSAPEAGINLIKGIINIHVGST